MKPTWEFDVGPINVHVFHCDEPVDAEDSEGSFEPTVHPYEIRLAKRLQGWPLALALCHEIVHLAYCLFSLGDVKADEEAVAAAVSFVFVEYRRTVRPYNDSTKGDA